MAYLARVLTLFSLAFPALGQSQPRVFTCPASIAVRESAAAYKFLRPSIFNGTPGKQEYELAPDKEHAEGKQVRQTWNLTDYRDQNLFVRCRYERTAKTLTFDLPAPLKTCTFSFRNVAGNQPVASPAFECR